MAESIEIQRITDWLVETTLGSFELDEFFPDFCQRVAGLGIGVSRGHIGMKTLHPLYNSIVMTWRRDRGLLVEKIGFEADTASWERSPLQALSQTGEEFCYYDLVNSQNWENYTLLRELKEENGTGYLALLVPFGRDEVALAQ